MHRGDTEHTVPKCIHVEAMHGRQEDECRDARVPNSTRARRAHACKKLKHGPLNGVRCAVCFTRVLRPRRRMPWPRAAALVGEPACKRRSRRSWRQGQARLDCARLHLKDQVRWCQCVFVRSRCGHTLHRVAGRKYRGGPLVERLAQTRLQCNELCKCLAVVPCRCLLYTSDAADE